jgi:hypothetical protein
MRVLWIKLEARCLLQKPKSGPVGPFTNRLVEAG